MVVVLVAEDVLAVLTLRPEVSSGDDGMEGESCAEAAKGRDEGDSYLAWRGGGRGGTILLLLRLLMLMRSIHRCRKHWRQSAEHLRGY
jgi:hypothetical protein